MADMDSVHWCWHGAWTQLLLTSLTDIFRRFLPRPLDRLATTTNGLTLDTNGPTVLDAWHMVRFILNLTRNSNPGMDTRLALAMDVGTMDQTQLNHRSGQHWRRHVNRVCNRARVKTFTGAP